ncbi:PIN domain-containing protein [Pontibacterium sp.]|uniref:PIN domain-containing protein n=1 Tax=Pontibacterium sp. TaxID=2036026 RepID=UPI0035126641
MQQLLISDSNVLIDLEEGGLTQQLFLLPYTFAVPDILYAEELEEKHGWLLDVGLCQKEMTPESMVYVSELLVKYSGPSFNDCTALALAKQEECPLITGDLRLRKAADKESVPKLGTIWLLEQMIIHGICSTKEVRGASLKMKLAGSRLPWTLLDDMLAKHT